MFGFVAQKHMRSAAALPGQALLPCGERHEAPLRSQVPTAAS